MFLANLKESEILHKEIKEPHNCLVILNIQKRNTRSILRSQRQEEKIKLMMKSIK